MNKLVLIISCFVFSSSILFAQSLKTKEVPKNITSLFKTKNPSAKSVAWEKDRDIYVVSFTEDKTQIKGYYEASGEWIKNMFDVQIEDLPTNIINYIKKNYSSYTSLEEIYFVKQEGEKDYYLVDVIVLSEKIISTIKFTVTGRYISEEKKDMPESVIAEESKQQNESVVEKVSDDGNKAKKEKKSKKSVPLDPDLISEDKIPAVVFKTFKKRFVNASDVKWYKKSEDTIYRVICVLRDQNAEGYITQDGDWISTVTELDAKQLSSMIYKSINEVYSKYTVVAAWNETRADKNNQIIVDVVEGKNKKSDLIIKMYFDKNAKNIRIIDPNVPKEEKAEDSKKQNKSVVEKESDDAKKVKKTAPLDPDLISEDKIPAVVFKTFKKRFVNASDVKWYKKSEDTIYRVICVLRDQNAEGYITQDGDWISTVTELDAKQLSSMIYKSINEVYSKYTVVAAWNETRADKNNQTIVDVVEGKNKKSDLIIKMYFDKNAKNIKIIDPNVPKEEKAEDSKKQNKSVVEKESDDAKKVKKVKKAKKTEPLDPDLINEDKIPAVVFKTFKKRFMNASDAKWYKKSEDTTYRIICVLRDQNTEGYITQNGDWISTVTELDIKQLPSAIYKSISEFYAEYIVVAAWNETRADKNNQIITDVVEGKNKKSNLITKMYFDKNAKIIKIVDAEIPKEEEAEISEKEKKEQKQFEKEFQKHQKMKYDPSNINESELPSGVGLWIAREYPEYLVRKAEYKEFDEYPEYRNIYKIFIERPGVNQPHAIGYFTLNGKLIGVVDDFKKEEEKKEVKREVTKEIVTAFKKQNPKIDKVTWKEGDEGTWIAVYTEKKFENEAIYTENATWLETKILIDSEEKIPSSIRNYVLKKIPGKEIQTCYLVKKSDVKPYYSITLYEKKTKTTLDLDFTTSGKLIE